MVYGPNAGISGATAAVENVDGTEGFNLMGMFTGCGAGCMCSPASCASLNWQPAGKTISVQLPNQPELTASITAPPGAYPGTNFTVDIALRNLGLMPAGNYACALYLTTTNTSITGGTPLGNFNQNGQAASSVVNVMRTVMMPPGTPVGTYYVAIVVDTNNTVAEVVETNNTVFSGPIATAPDLTGSVAIPAVTGPGEVLDIDFTLTNRGAPVATPVSVTFYFSTNEMLDSFDTMIDPTQLITLPDGFTFNGTVSLTVPPGIQPSPPNYYVIADIDDTDQIAEPNENNNEISSPTTVDIDGPDLVAETFTGADIAFRGLTYPVGLRIHNTGGATARDFTACVVLSDNLLISLVSDTVLIETGLMTLVPGESATLMLQPMIPTDTATGTWYIAGVADCQTVVNEAIETNNTKRRDQTILIRDVAPDFIPLEISTSSAAAAGEQLPVAVRFANLGNAPGATHLRIVVSDNAGITDTDPSIYDSATAVPLTPPGESTSAVWASIPGDLPSGNYYIGAIVDPDDLVDEVYEDNNTASVGPIVVVGADLAIVSPAPPPAIIGVEYTRRFSAVGGVEDYAWSVTWPNGAPAGLSFDPALGELHGTPTAAGEGSHPLTVRVTSGNLSATKSYSLIVTPPTIGLEVVSSRLPPALALESYRVQLVAVGGTPPYTWSLGNGTVPPGLGVSALGELGGEPQLIGAFTFEVEVRDLTGALATGLLAIDVVDPSSSITITTADVPDGEVGTQYDTSFAAAGGTPPYQWRLEGRIPPGLSFDLDHATLTGTPTIAGDYPLVVEVRDQRGLLDRNAYVLAILEEGALQITNGQSSETGLPPGKVGVDYLDPNGEPVRLRAVKPGGDLSSLVWSVLDGSLPAGIGLDAASGVISGTPSQSGTFPFIVQVRDASNDVSRTSLVIFVEPPDEGMGGGGDDGGCGCSAAGRGQGSPWSFLFLAALAGLWGLGRRRRSALLLVGLAVLPATARAQAVPYQVFESVEPFEPLDGSAQMTSGLGDGNTVMIPLPFEFYFYGQPQSAVWINANGLIGVMDLGFGNHYPPGVIPSVGSPNGFIAGLWSDWCADAVGCFGVSNPGMGVFYRIDPSPGDGSITIEFRRLRHYTDDQTASSATFQITLHEGLSSMFDIHFGPMSIGTDFLGQPTLIDARIGMENTSGTAGMWLGPCQANPCDNATILGLPDQKITVIADAGEDVTVAGVQVPHVGYPGLPFPASARVISRHQDPLGPFRYGVYLIPGTGTSTAGGALLFQSGPITLSGYESRSVSFEVEVPNDQPVGQYRVGVRVDQLDEIDETSEANNFAFSTQTVRIADRAPDLRVLSLRPLATEVRPGEMLSVAYRVQNFGNEPGRLEMQGYLSSNSAITISDFPLGGRVGFDTQPRETVTGTLTAMVPAGIATGAYYFGLILDPDLTLAELDETNNIGRSAERVIVSSADVAIITDALPPATLGQGYSARVRAAGGTGVFTYSLASGSLPSGMTFSPSTGELAGVPLTVGSFELQIRATSGNVTGMKTLDLEVLDPSYPLTIATHMLPDGTLGGDYAVSLVAVGGARPYSWRLREGSLPRGVLLAPDGTLFGSPDQAGFAAFSVEVRDNMSATASVALNLDIRSPGNLTIVSSDLIDGQIEEPYSQQLIAVGGVGALAWRAVTTLPPGLSITNTGVLAGIPEIARSYRFRVEVTDERGNADTNQLTMAVLATGRFAIATEELPVGAPNTEYRALIKAEGGAQPYTWELIRGEGFLPPGFVVEQSDGIAEGETENDLVVRGNLEREGTWAFTARVFDAKGRFDERPFAIVSRTPVVVEMPDESGGCGCTTSGGRSGGLWGLLLLPLAFVLRSRRRIAPTLAVLGLVLSSAPASAQLYVAAQYSAPYVPLTGAAPLSLTDDDDGMASVSIPFPFSYYGVSYDTIDVGVNGAAIFANSCTGDAECDQFTGACVQSRCVYDIDYQSIPMPSTEPPDRILGVFWDDMILDAPNAAVSTQVMGSAPNRQLVIEWSNVSHYDFGGGSISHANYQIRLDEASGSVRFHYGPFTSAADDFLWDFAVVGIENDGGTDAVVPLPCAVNGNCGAVDLQALVDQVIEFALPVGPELVGSATSGTGGDVGAPLSIALTVQNIGTQPSGAFAAAFYFSTDNSVIEPTDMLLGTANFASIAQMGLAMRTLNTTVPNVAPGLYTVGAIIDSNNQVMETIETNNAVVATTAFLVGADLAVAVAPIGSTGPNEVGNAEVTIVNNGSAQPAVGVAVYLSADTLLNPATDYLIGTATVAVPAQPNTPVSVPYQIPGTIVPGDYWVIAQVDFTNAIAEANENNNVGISLSTTEVAGADVVASQVDAVGNFIFIGGQLQVSARISNTGGATTPPFYYAFHLSENELINSLTDPLLGELGPITLAPGQSVQVMHTLDVPASLAPGMYYLGLIADSQSSVIEQFETNNIGRTQRKLDARAPAPDFTVSEIRLPINAAAGESFVVARTMANAGNAPGGIDYQIYLSSDSTIDPMTDVPIGTGTVALSAFGEDVGVDRVHVPSTVAGGNYYVGYVLDPADATEELDEGNNRVASQGTLVVLASQLVILTGDLPVAVLGTEYQVLFGAAGGTGGYVWSIAGGTLPTGLTLDAGGLLSGTTTEEGIFTFTVSVRAGMLTSVKSFTVIVSAKTLPLEIVTRSLVPGFVAHPYRYPLTAFGGIPPYRWTVDGLLPPGLEMDANGVIFGAPTMPAVDTLTFRVEDATGAFDDRPIAIRVVNPDDTVRMSDDVLPDGSLGEEYDVTLRVAPGTGASPFEFALAGGSLPDGLILERDRIYGIPGKVGFYSFAIRASDSRGDFDVNRYVVEISEANGISFVTSDLPRGVVQQEYADEGGSPVRLRAVSAEAPAGTIVFRVISGQVPPGLSLADDGAISGTPSSSGIFPFTVLAQDELGQIEARAFGIRVEDPLTTPPPLEEGGGCGCSAARTGGSSAAWGLLLLLGALLPLRRRRSLIAAVLVLVPGIASAQTGMYQTQTLTETYQERTGGTPIAFPSDDDDQATVTLPFPFHYFDADYTQVTVGTNGYVTFDTDGDSRFNEPILSQNPPNNMIALWWTDLITNNASTIVEGTAPNRVFIVQWEDAEAYFEPTGGIIKMQVLFYEGPSGQFEVRYGPISNLSDPFVWAATTGFEDPSGLQGGPILGCSPFCSGTDFSGAQDLVFRALEDGGPDIVASDLVLPSVAYPGIPFAVPIRIQSLHMNPLGPFVYQVHLLTLGESAPNNPIFTSTPVTLGPYQTLDETPLVSLPLDQASGRYRLALVADANDQVMEPSELDNVFIPAGDFRVAARQPDFTVANVSPSVPSASPGTSISVTVALANAGNLDGAADWSLVLSQNRVISVDDVEVHTGTIALPLLTTSSVSVQVDLPSDLEPGAYYLGVLMDPNDAVHELDEVNNTGVSAAPLTVASTSLAVTTSALPGGYVDVPYSVFLRASGGDGTYQWSMAGGSLPQGLNLLPSGEIRGSPRSRGSALFTVAVTSGGVDAQADLEIAVDTVEGGLSIVTRELLPGIVGDAYPPADPGTDPAQQQHIVAVGGASEVHFTLKSIPPPGLELDADGYLHGVSLQAGDYDLDLEATDGGQTVQRTLILTVAEPGRLTLVSAVLPDAQLGDEYAVQLRVLGKSATSTVTFDTGGPLPDGLALAPNGRLVGVPQKVGVWLFSVRAIEGTGVTSGSDTANFRLAVLQDEGLGITPSTLPTGIVGEAYSAVMEARAGVPPFTWRVLGQSLPRGMAYAVTMGERETLELSGIPEEEAFVTFMVTVTDGDGRYAAQAVSISDRRQGRHHAHDAGRRGLLLPRSAGGIRRQRGRVVVALARRFYWPKASPSAVEWGHATGRARSRTSPHRRLRGSADREDRSGARRPA